MLKKVRVTFNLTLEDKIEGGDSPDHSKPITHKMVREQIKYQLENWWTLRNAKITSLTVDNVELPGNKQKSVPEIALGTISAAAKAVREKYIKTAKAMGIGKSEFGTETGV